MCVSLKLPIKYSDWIKLHIMASLLEEDIFEKDVQILTTLHCRAFREVMLACHLPTDARGGCQDPPSPPCPQSTLYSWIQVEISSFAIPITWSLEWTLSFSEDPSIPHGRTTLQGQTRYSCHWWCSLCSVSWNGHLSSFLKGLDLRISIK